MTAQPPLDPADKDAASRRVYRGILRALERRELVPGQRLVETDLATRYGVGRNAVREAMQWLGAHGVMDLGRYRSPAIRTLDLAETLEVLEVAEAAIVLIVRSAARACNAAHTAPLAAALAELDAADDEPGGFGRARRHVWRALLAIAGNRELARLFPAIGLHVVHAGWQTPRLRRPADYRAIATAVVSGDADAAEAAARHHLAAVRAIIEESAVRT